MTGLRLELPDPSKFSSPQEYIEKHLAPALTELHRITNELLAPGATSTEEHAVDMVPPPNTGGRFSRLDRPLYQWAKHVTFQGQDYFSLPKALLKAKQVKVQLTAVVYACQRKLQVTPVQFRLVDSSGDVIDNSELRTAHSEPQTLTAVLPFGEHRGCIHPSIQTYFIEGSSDGSATPVCRRFSLSFIYI